MSESRGRIRAGILGLDQMPEHMRGKAMEAVDAFFADPESVARLREGMEHARETGDPVVIPILKGAWEPPPYPPLSPEAERYNELVGLDITPDDAIEWDGQSDMNTDAIRAGVEGLRFLTAAEKYDAYHHVIQCRRLSMSFIGCWQETHRQITQAHHAIAVNIPDDELGEEDDPCGPRMHGEMDLDRIGELAGSLGGNLANLAMIVASMRGYEHKVREVMETIDRRAYEAGEWPPQSDGDGDGATGDNGDRA